MPCRWLPLSAVLAVVLFAGGAAITVFALRGTGTAQEADFLPPTVTMTAPGTVSGPVAEPLTRSVPVRLRIPAIGVNAPVMELGANADGSVQVPPLANPNLAGWYKYGPAPGQLGAAVILGHVDSSTGISVFYRLRYLRRGDKVYIALAGGRLAAFAVDGVQEAAKNDFPTRRVYGKLPYPGLRLITCGGTFDTTTRHYLDNIIVYAHLTAPGARPRAADGRPRGAEAAREHGVAAWGQRSR